MYLRRSISLFLIILISFSGIAYGQKVGLVLSGGGARGLAHIGVIKALEENNIPIDYITGTSMGAMIGGLYSAGYSPQEMERFVTGDEFQDAARGVLGDELKYYFFKKEDNASVITLKISHDSIWQTHLPINVINPVPVDFALMEYLSMANAKSKYDFDSLFIPFRCVAANIETKEQVIWASGNLGEAIRSSMAFPFYFSPVVNKGNLLFDGGLYNNFPADIMLNTFQPDIILGSNVSGKPHKPDEENFLSQIRTMVVNKSKYDILCDNGCLIEPPVNDIDIFNFTSPEEIIKAGYDETIRHMPTIKARIERRVSAMEMENRRKAFFSSLPPILVDQIYITGVTADQAEYARKLIKPKPGLMSFAQFKKNYFKLAADDNVRRVFPKLKYNSQTGTYDIYLDIKRETDLIAQFGGNFSSRPISEAFVGFQYNFWKKQSVSISANTYFGKLYNAGQIKARIDVPARFPFYSEVELGLNQWDYFKSSSIVLEDIRPSYLIYSDKRYCLNLGIPLRMKGKMVLGTSVVNLIENYYQTEHFGVKDTADETSFLGSSSYLAFERSTLNKKLYANEGTFLLFKLRYTEGFEELVPGSTSLNREKVDKFRKWFQANFKYENYYKRRGNLKLGFYSEIVYADLPLFQNYLSSILISPAFQPVNDSKTIFLDVYRSHTFAGVGLENVYNIRKNMDFRLEGYMYQPYQEIVKADNGLAVYGPPLAKRYLILSSALVYHSPIGPVAVSVNYYEKQKNPISVLFHFGFIMFNKKALD